MTAPVRIYCSIIFICLYFICAPAGGPPGLKGGTVNGCQSAGGFWGLFGGFLREALQQYWTPWSWVFRSPRVQEGPLSPDLSFLFMLKFLPACLRIGNARYLLIANFSRKLRISVTDAKRVHFAICLNLFKEVKTLVQTLLESCKMIEFPLSYTHLHVSTLPLCSDMQSAATVSLRQILCAYLCSHTCLNHKWNADTVEFELQSAKRDEASYMDALRHAMYVNWRRHASVSFAAGHHASLAKMLRLHLPCPQLSRAVFWTFLL